MNITFLLGLKMSSEQLFNADGNRVVVTKIATSPCYLVDVRTQEKDGYNALVIGFGTAKANTKTLEGKFKKAGITTPLRFLKEIRIDDLLDKGASFEVVEEGKKRTVKMGEKEFTVGQEIKAQDMFVEGDMVQVTGTSKGKGFQGVVRRHGFAGGPKTHGQSDRHRAPGSIGQGTTPGRVYKGKRMAGRMGGETSTVKNLKIVQADEVSLSVAGLVPGAKNGLITIRSVR